VFGVGIGIERVCLFARALEEWASCVQILYVKYDSVLFSGVEVWCVQGAVPDIGQGVVQWR
jgi:hypothetical protein